MDFKGFFGEPVQPQESILTSATKQYLVINLLIVPRHYYFEGAGFLPIS